MDTQEFKKDFIESIKTAATVTGEGSCAAFVDNMAEYLIDAEVLSDFTPSFYTGRSARNSLVKKPFSFSLIKSSNISFIKFTKVISLYAKYIGPI